MNTDLRVGSMVYDCIQGLGVLAKSFYDAGVVTHPVIVTRPTLKSRPSQLHWYPKETPRMPISGIVRSQVLDHWQRNKVQVALFFETPFDWPLVRRCKELDIKTVIMPMFECMPVKLPFMPDLFINPSLLDQQYYPKGKFIPVPVDQFCFACDGRGYLIDLPEEACAVCGGYGKQGVRWRRRTTCEVFVHNAGHGGLKGRNGTGELIEALPLVKSGARFIIRTQEKMHVSQEGLQDRVQFTNSTVPYEQLFEEGDCFIFPEKFNGLSLPLQEARASGMLIMCGNRFPMNTWLPTAPLIPVHNYRNEKIGGPYNTFHEAMFNPEDIAKTVDAWYGKDITSYSDSGRTWANATSWKVLKPKYMEVLEGLLK